MTGRKFTPESLRDHIRRLALDWAYLRIVMPKTPRGDDVRRSGSQDYGHPAEWASDTAASIATILSSWHDLMAEHRNERRPPTGAEAVRVRAAWKYLDPRCAELMQLVEDEALQEIPALHGYIRCVLGVTDPKYVLPLPCPNDDCGLRTLMRTVSVRNDYIACGSCGYTIQEAYYPLLVRMALDTVIDASANNTAESQCRVEET